MCPKAYLGHGKVLIQLRFKEPWKSKTYFGLFYAFLTINPHGVIVSTKF
jgi:hypothetical protein